MKLAINITREPLAGVTTTNLSLLNHLHGTNTQVVGIELNSFRTFFSPIVYRHLSPEWFKHQIISTCDYSLMHIVKRAKTLKEVEIAFKDIIDIIRGIFRTERPDTVVVNGTYFMPWLIAIAARKEKIPVVLWYAGILTKETEGMTTHFRTIFTEMERSIIKSACKIIFPSNICKETVFDQVLKSSKVRSGLVVPNPISPIYTRAAVESPVDRRIAFVGRCTAIKNLEAFCLLHKKLLAKGWKHQATIVSNIPQSFLKKIPKTIRIISSMQPDELKTFYTSQGLIISPSHFETFGNVPVEAACLGIPVLVNETMGCAEVFRDAGLEGMVVNFQDIERVVSRVQELCGQHILPKQINNLRKAVDTQYIANTIVSAIQKSF